MYTETSILGDGAQLGDFLCAIDGASLAGLGDAKRCRLRGVDKALAGCGQTPAQLFRWDLTIPAFERD